MRGDYPDLGHDVEDFLSGSNCGRKSSTTHLEFQESQKKKTDAAKAHSYQATSFHVGDQTNFLFPLQNLSVHLTRWILIGGVFGWVGHPWKDPMFCKSVDARAPRDSIQLFPKSWALSTYMLDVLV